MDTMFEITMTKTGLDDMVRVCDPATLVYLLRLQALAIEADPQSADRATGFAWKEIQ